MAYSDLVADARRATEEALRALWAFFNRPNPDGKRWGDVSGFDSLEEYRAHFAERPGRLAETCHMAVSDPGIREEEIEALRRYVGLSAAIELRVSRKDA